VQAFRCAQKVLSKECLAPKVMPLLEHIVYGLLPGNRRSVKDPLAVRDGYRNSRSNRVFERGPIRVNNDSNRAEIALDSTFDAKDTHFVLAIVH
jgi:hypothetical protein